MQFDHFDHIHDLKTGSVRQRLAYDVLMESRLFDVLKPFSPMLVGTIPLDIDTENSDLDIICQVEDFDEFKAAAVENYESCEDFNVNEEIIMSVPAIYATFKFKGFPIEIFGQPRPVKEQNGYLHMMIEARFLELSGEEARENIRTLKRKGFKTEPAFGYYYHLSGDPYNRLIELVHASDAELRQIIEAKMDTGFSESREKDNIIKLAQEYVQEQLKHDSSGHDWWHILRVAKTAETIAKQEKANLFICKLAAILHDVADEKFNPSLEEGLQKVRAWLEKNRVDRNSSAEIIDIISSMSFRGGNQPPMKTLEGKIVQDADRLDAMGAIGISRTFAYSGFKGRPIYDPGIPPRTSMTPEEYRSGKDTAINHFYEKLLKLKDLMNTDYGKKLAVQRHEFMEAYLEQFFLEWAGGER
jgi:uncharacterized protein